MAVKRAAGKRKPAAKPRRKFHLVRGHTKKVAGKKVKVRTHIKSMPKASKKRTPQKKGSKNMTGRGHAPRPKRKRMAGGRSARKATAKKRTASRRAKRSGKRK
jgi:hypothetical protein